ncbi:MAG: toxin-antitoxin system TumE family protein [bacterium]
MSNMPAEPLLDERHVLNESAFVELVVWRVPVAVRGSQHEFRYRLALVVDGECILRYDNEAGKGDHRHVRDKEYEYRFKNAQQLLADFWKDVEEMLK